MDWLAPFLFDAQRAYETVITTVILYVFVILVVRILGIRSVSHMNNFDWIVMVAIGAICGAAIISPDVTVTQSVIAISSLFAVQWSVTTVVARSERLQKLIKLQPKVLLHNGIMDEEALEHERITEDEIEAEIRGKGLKSWDEVEEVVLEPDATVSVVPKDRKEGNSALQDRQ